MQKIIYAFSKCNLRSAPRVMSRYTKKGAALNKINKRLPKIKLSLSINPVSRGCYSQKCFHYIKRKHNADYGSFVHKVLCF